MRKLELRAVGLSGSYEDSDPHALASVRLRVRADCPGLVSCQPRAPLPRGAQAGHAAGIVSLHATACPQRLILRRPRQLVECQVASEEEQARECERIGAAVSASLAGSRGRVHVSALSEAGRCAVVDLLPGDPALPTSLLKDELIAQACDESSPLRTRLPEVVGAESAAPGAMPEALIHADLSDLELYCRTAAEDAAMAGDGAVEAQPVFVSRAYEALRDLKRKSADAVERARLSEVAAAACAFRPLQSHARACSKLHLCLWFGRFCGLLLVTRGLGAVCR